MRHKHNVDCVEPKLRGKRVARRKIMCDGAVDQAKIHALNAKNGGGLRGFVRARGHIAKGRGLAVASVNNDDAVTLRNKQGHGCPQTKFSIIWMRCNYRNIHADFLQIGGDPYPM